MPFLKSLVDTCIYRSDPPSRLHPLPPHPTHNPLTFILSPRGGEGRVRGRGEEVRGVGWGRVRGRRSVNRAPPPEAFAHASLPPCSSAIWRAMASPSPVPRGFVGKNGSQRRGAPRGARPPPPAPPPP